MGKPINPGGEMGKTRKKKGHERQRKLNNRTYIDAFPGKLSSAMLWDGEEERGGEEERKGQSLQTETAKEGVH